MRLSSAALRPTVSTDHDGNQSGFVLQAEVVFFLTDADLMTDAEVDQLLAERGKTRISAVDRRGAGLAGMTHPEQAGEVLGR